MVFLGDQFWVPYYSLSTYINDLPHSSNLLSFFLFADDTNIYFGFDDLARLAKKVNEELSKIKFWLDYNKLALNIDKTNLVFFHSPRKKLPDLLDLRFGKRSIKRTKYVKFMGVLVDEHSPGNITLANFVKNYPEQMDFCSNLDIFFHCLLLSVLQFTFFIFSQLWPFRLGSYP